MDLLKKCSIDINYIKFHPILLKILCYIPCEMQKYIFLDMSIFQKGLVQLGPNLKLIGEQCTNGLILISSNFIKQLKLMYLNINNIDTVFWKGVSIWNMSL